MAQGCPGNVRMRRTTNTVAASRDGDYGAVARGYGYIVEHCPHCTRPGHAGMTCHQSPAPASGTVDATA
jgi:hypothetical protein